MLVTLKPTGYISQVSATCRQSVKDPDLKLTSGRIPLLSPEFDDILKVVHSFHDGSLGCASFDYHGPMAFIDMMWFGRELGYNPKPIIGGVFLFDLNDKNQVT